MATPVANAVPLSGNSLIDGLMQGAAWTFGGPRVLTYSLSINFDQGLYGAFIPGPGGDYTAAASSAFRSALAAWASVANISFQEVAPGSYFPQSTADIATALTGSDIGESVPGAVAVGVLPDPGFAEDILSSLGLTREQYAQPEGDVLFDNFHQVFGYLNPGQAGFHVMLHELGHALGLKHPNDDGQNLRPTFASLGITQYDQARYTVMHTPLSGGFSSGFAATPMPLDIQAIQRIYGANTSYRTGDDTYTVSVDSVMRTIWDAGGIDTLDASALAVGGTLDLRPGSVTDLGNGTVLAIAYNCIIENATGGTSFNTLYGNAANNVLAGGGGGDRYYGGAGNDSYVVSGSGDVVTENQNEGLDTIFAPFSAYLSTLDPLSGVENVTLTGTANESVRGNALANTLTGNAGANLLDGNGGADTLIGGLGDDTYYALNPGIVIVENAGEGDDTIVSATSLVLMSNFERLILFTQSAATTGTGNAADNRISGNEGHNLLAGLAGNDSLWGFAGNDTIDGGDGNDNLDGESGDDLLVGGFNFDTLLGGLGNDTLRGGDQNDSLTGGDGNDSLAGGKGLDTLEGGEGNDTIAGMVGNDNIDGGNGFDLADYSISTDGVTANLAAGLGGSTYPVGGTGSGADVLIGIEGLLGSAFNDLFTGNVFANQLTGNNGNDTIDGSDGNDTIDGGDGNDSLLGGISADFLTGGAGQDFVSGGKGTDTVGGGEGNDTLAGGLGTDSLIGGNGADRFQFRTLIDGVVNIDTVADFVSATDVIEIAVAGSGMAALSALIGQTVGIGDGVGQTNLLVYDALTGALGYHAGEPGGNAPMTFAILGGAPALGSDFVIVV